MLTETDFLEDNERQNILNVAPAEGNRPLSVFRDKLILVRNWHTLEYSLVKHDQKVNNDLFRLTIVTFVNQN